MSPAGRKAISLLLAVAIIVPPHFTVAVAEMITTESALAAEKREVLISNAEAYMLRDEVSAQFTRLGVDQDQVMARIRSMTNDELAGLAREIDSLPAGAGAIEIIGNVFLVLLILELVGVTDIFKKF